MNLRCFLITWLVHITLLSVCYSSELEAGMTGVFDSMSEKLLSSLTRSLEKPLDRRKRDLDVKPNFDSDVYRVANLKPVSRLCHPAVRTLFLDVSNTTYAVCIAASTTHSPAETVVGYYKEHTWTPVHRWIVNNAVDAVAFHFKNHIYVLVADSENNFGPELMKINLRTNALVRDHVVNGIYATSIAVWKMKTNGQINLAVANSNGLKDVNTNAFIYKWTGTYFDQYTSFPAYDVKDIEPFHIHGVAYIAVANFRRGKGVPGVDSEIFRFDQDKINWISHQKIATYGAIDWEFFSLGTSLGQEFFLAVANKGYDGKSNAKSMIYKFVEDKFVPFQCLPTTKATAIASFSKNGMFVLAVANENDAVHLYQYDGWRFVRSEVQSTSGAMAEGVVSLKFHTVMVNQHEVLILSVSNPRHPLYQSVFEISFSRDNLLDKWRSRSTEWCLKMLSKLESSDLDKTLDFSSVIFTDQPTVSINGDVVFEQGFVADTLKTPKFKDLSTQEVFDDNLVNKLVSLQERLNVIKTKLEGFSDVLKNSFRVEGTQTIKRNFEFNDASFNCRNRACDFKNIHTEVLNGEKIGDWENRLVFTNRKQILNGTLIARGINAPNLNVLGSIDGVKNGNLVTKSGDFTIMGHKHFRNSITAQDIAVSGTVDGVTILPSTILLSTGHQTIRGNLSFGSVSTSWLKAGYVNSKNLTEFYDELILTGKSYKVLGKKSFNDVVVNEVIMTPESTINGVDLVDLWEKSLWVDGIQEIQAEMTFSGVTLERNLDVSFGINGIEIPGSKIADITEPTIFVAPQVFQNSTSMRNLEVLESLNGISVLNSDGSNQLDVMLKTGNQIITGAKTFHTIHLDANSDVKGTVDGVDLSELGAAVLRKNTSIVANGTWVFNSLLIKGPLTVEGTVSNINLDEVYEKALKLNEAVIPEIIFENLVHMDDLRCTSINDIDIENEFVLVNEPQTLTGKKTFDKVILEEDTTVLGLVNRMNFSFINEILLVIGNQHIESKNFSRNVAMGNLTVEGTINGVSVTDIVSLDGGKIAGSTVLDRVTFSKIEAKNVEMTGKVNSIDLKEMMADTMTYNGDQVVTGVKDVKGTLHILPDANIAVNNFNGLDLNALWDDAVFTDLQQEISGTVIFEDNVTFDDFLFVGTVDGVSDWEIRNWMLKDKPQIVENNTTFKNGFAADNLTVNLVNGMDLNHLNSDIVRVNEASEILGSVIFENSVTSTNTVDLTGKLQGIDLSEEAVPRNNVIVTAEKRFTQDVVFGDLNVDGLINNLDITDLCTKTFLKNDDVNVTRLIVKGDVVLEEGSIDGYLSGVDLSLLKDLAIKDDGQEIHFSDLKTFTSVSFDGPITLKGKFNGIDLNQLVGNYFSISKDQEIMAKMDFSDLRFEGILSAAKLDTADKEINGINLPQLNTRLLKTLQTQTVTASYHIDEVHFESDVFVAGKVNGLELPSELMRHNHTNYIRSPKIFEQPLIVYGGLHMEEGKTIQDVDVSEWFKKSVLNQGKFKIHGHKIFNEIHLNDVKVEGTLDGLKISEENLLMVYGNQVISRRKAVSGKVEIEGSLVVDGLINMINLGDLAKAALQRDDNSSVSGPKYFTQPLTTLSLRTPSVAGIDIVQLKEKLNATIDLSPLENRLEEIRQVQSNMQLAYNNQAVIFKYYELFDEFALPSAYGWVYVSGNDCGELLLLLDESGPDPPCSSIRIFGFDEVTHSFVPARQELITQYAISVKSLMLNSTFLYVANKYQNSQCSGIVEIDKTALDIYTWNVDSFIKLQSLHINQPSDMAVFKGGNSACLILLEEDSKVYCSVNNIDWSVGEILLTKRGLKVSVLQSRKVIAAILAEDALHLRKDYMDGQRYIDIYLWNSTLRRFSAPRQVITSTFTKSIALVKHADKNSEEVFLVIAEGSVPKIHNKPKILIYRYEDYSDVFRKYQEIEDYGTLEWLSLKTGELLLFAVDSQSGEVKVYQYKGLSGFVKIDVVKSLGIKSVHAFNRPDPEDWLNHYLALAGPSATAMQGEYHPKILKSKMKGKRLL